MKENTREKKTRQGLSLSPQLLEAAKAKGGDNLSAYIRGLIERDISGEIVSDATAPTVLSTICAQLRPDLLEEFAKAVGTIGIKEPRLLAELIHLVVDYAKNGGDFRGDFDPFIGSTQIPNISKACARGRSRDTNAAERTPPVRAREELCDILRRLADHAGLDQPTPTKDLSELLQPAERLMKAARDTPSLGNISYPEFNAPTKAVAEPQSTYGGKAPKRPPKPPSTGTTP